ncbi:hypothetical protein Tco_0667879 [Tanacetum coccineum]
MTLQDLRIQEAIHSDYVIPNHFFIALMTSNFPMRLSRIAWKYSWKTSPSLVVLSTTASKIGEDAKKMRGNQPCIKLIHDKKGAENLTADHLSRLENPDLGKLTRADIRDLFPEERLMGISDKNNKPWTDEVSYKMPHKIEQYDSLSDLEKEHTKSVYLRNGEDKRKGVEYVMSKILGFYKECLELGPEYLTGMDDEGEVT